MPGDVIGGRFTIESTIGTGAMGVVYRALDQKTGEPVALKMLRDSNELHARRFAREARILSELRHPGIVRYVAHADVFALASVAFRCVTGRKPFVATEIMAMLLKIVLEEPPSAMELAPEVPAALDRLLARMLAKDPERRPADGFAVVTELSAL